MGEDVKIRACTLSDLSAVTSVLMHPEVFPHTKCDGNDAFSIPDMLAQGPPMYVLMDDSNSMVVITHPITNTIFNVHTNALPSIRGKKSRAIEKAMIEWLWANTKCEAIMGFNPTRNIAAVKNSSYAGFESFGVIKNGIIQDGEYDDIHIFVLSKGKWNA